MITRGLSRAPSERREKRGLIGFAVGPVHYGVDIMRIREIINPGALVPIPGAGPHALGVTEHRNAVIPIVSARRRFGLPDAPVDRRTKWILLVVEEREMGLEVDRVTQVLKLSEDERLDQRSMVAGAGEPWIRAVFAHGAGLVFEIDVDFLMGGEAVFQIGDGRGDPRDGGSGKA